MEKKIGFIGLGAMGKWTALNVRKAGFNLTVSDLSPHALQFLSYQGDKAAASPGELAARPEWIFLSLPSTATVEEVIFGEKGLIKGTEIESLIVDCGTTGYLQTIDFERRLRGQGILFAAPVSDMEARAKEGTLTVMFGGEKKVFDQLTPLFDAMSNKVLLVGQVGSGQLAKLVNQLLFNISCAAIAEVLPMAAKLSLDPQKVTEVVTPGTDRSFAVEFLANHKIPLTLVSACPTTYQMALANGFGDEGKGAMIKVFERILDTKFRKRKESS